MFIERFLLVFDVVPFFAIYAFEFYKCSGHFDVWKVLKFIDPFFSTKILLRAELKLDTDAFESFFDGIFTRTVKHFGFDFGGIWCPRDKYYSVSFGFDSIATFESDDCVEYSVSAVIFREQSFELFELCWILLSSLELKLALANDLNRFHIIADLENAAFCFVVFHPEVSIDAVWVDFHAGHRHFYRFSIESLCGGLLLEKNKVKERGCSAVSC